MNDLIDWKKVKADYDNGFTDQHLAEKYSIKKTTVSKYRLRHWGKANKLKKSKRVLSSNLKKTKLSSKKKTIKRQKDKTKDNYVLSDLTPEQEYYCKLRSEQYPQYSAYRVAYDKDYKLTDATVSTKASRLESDPKISSRIGKLIENKASVIKWDNDAAIEKMLDIFYRSMESVLINGVTKSNSDSVYNAFDRLNKLIGFDMLSKLQKQKLKADLDLTQAKLNKLDGTDNEQLNQISDLLDEVKKQI